MSKSSSAYLYIFYYHFLTILAYPYELLITVIEPAAEIGFLVLFWGMVARGSSHPIDLISMVAYFIMVQFVSIWSLNPGGLNFSNYIGYRIKSGILSQSLIRPIRTLPALLFEHRGYFFVDMIFSVILLALAIKLLGGIELNQLVMFIVFSILSCIITFSLCVLIGSLAFITKEISSIRHSVSHLVRILSGAMVPLNFFPEGIRHWLSITPFPSMVFVPISVLQNKLPPTVLLFNFKVALFWSFLLLGAALLIWQRNMKKYEANGI
jgi:ABC-2 type transport system permease protein